MADRQSFGRIQQPMFIRVLMLASIAVSALALDQIAKFAIVHFVMQPPRPIAVTSFFDLVLVFNSGISFGLFSSQIGAFPMLVASAKTAIVVGLFAWGALANSRLERFALATIAGGATGNIVDRFRDGAVTDYLSFHVGGWYWPAFNLSDVFIVAGAAAMLACAFVKPRANVDGDRNGD